MRASDLLNQLLSECGVTARDNVVNWVCEALGIIGELSFPWNKKKTNFLTHAEYTFLGTSGIATFGWVEGNNFITCTDDLYPGFGVDKSGRKVMLGDEVYRIIEIGLTDIKLIYVDRVIRGSATLQTPKFFKDEYAIRTAMLHTIEVDRCKLPNVRENRLDDVYYYNHHRFSASPYYYVDENSIVLQPPIYAPVVNSTAAGSFSDGTYYYFFTRYDSESGLESEPGPILKYVSQSANSPVVTYNNPSPAGKGELGYSYRFRLYRSQKNPKITNPPMFLVADQIDVGQVISYVDTNTTDPMRGKTQYDWSKQTVVRLVSPPDSTRRTLIIKHNEGYGKRLWEDENINLGTNNAVIEILRMHIKACSQLQSNDVVGYRTQVITFRNQLAYLLGSTQPAAHGDYNESNYKPIAPGFESEETDWVDFLPNYNMDS
jgi:hypothetical protein